ncbi:MAG: cupin domain-containing protein [Chloroflexota bacterium]|nr:cupin domain-containing protein [Chloroflexota bacterium]
MKIFTAFLLMILTALPLAVSAAARPTASIDPTTVAQVDMPVTLAAGDYSLLGFVLDFPTGAGIPEHVHGGPVVVTVLEGNITLQENGTERTVQTGDTFLEPVGRKHAVINRGTTNCRLAGAEMLPKGAADTTLVGDSGGAAPPTDPTTVAQVEYPITIASGNYDLLGFVLDFAPGAGIPLHIHGGPVALMALDGTLSLEENGTERALHTGDTFLEPVGHRHAVINRSTLNFRLAGAELLPKGAADTTLVNTATPGMPSTGAGSADRLLPWILAMCWLVLAAGVIARSWRPVSH